MDHVMRKLEVERTVAAKVVADAAFRARLRQDPRAALAELFGAELPAGLRVVVHEDEPETMHLVVPGERMHAGELADSQLDRVSGGTWCCGFF